MREKQIAVQAAKKAGKILVEGFESCTGFKMKSKHEVVTKFDLKAEKIILDLIKKNFPDHKILSEESGMNEKKSDYFWLVDPLDGTTNFVMKNPLFAVSIALAYRNEIILGVIYVPFLDELFVAEKGKGAFLNNKLISVSSKNKIEESILTFCNGCGEKNFKRAIKIYQTFKTKALDLRQLGSAACELAWVACGRTEAIMIPGVNSWDIAAGTLLVKEAGGKATDFKGKEWMIDLKDISASNKKISLQILKYLKNI